MQVFALVGQSGTGKSHHASLLANELGTDLIVDDGLAIMEGKILAGQSSKREQSRLAAVRRAIFSDPGHAAEVREKIREVSPDNVLIIGTSRAMVNRIAEALAIPEPQKYVDIREVATHDEIRRALKVRKEQGKHVIPAPTLEVRRSFSGYLVDPLRFFIPKRSNQSANLVVEKSVVRPTWSSFGRFYIADSVVGAIAVKSCREIDGMARVRKVVVESTDEGVNVDLEVAIKHGVMPFEVLGKAQKHVKKMVEYCTALNVLSVDVAARKVSLE
ncbi:MAG: Asp23/Gls24 family envelope stress response protein [Bacillota bacterium]|nr:Asp23/Gls24 family envelope stress response protein [Bacillota bacterium]